MLSTNNSLFEQRVSEKENSYIPLLSNILSIKAQSAGYFAGNFAKVEINGTVMQANSRGIHVWVIDRNENIILERASFDTHISKDESQEFSKFLKWIATGMVIIIASKDEFIENLTEDAIAALEQLGSAKIRDVEYRDSYVFIGEKGNTKDILEAHQQSKDGPTELIEKSFKIAGKLEDANDMITVGNLSHFFPNSNGRWLRRRKNDGALNRVPSNFFPQVWTTLDNSKGLMIKSHSLPRDPIVLEKTPEEFNFALAVESFLGWFADPAERQVAVETLSILYSERYTNMGWLDLPLILNRAVQNFWTKWVALNKTCIERGGELFGKGDGFESHVELARKLFFDLPLDGTESTSTYIKESLTQILK
jgi:phosphorylase kinase alpha/beta subunit